MRRLVAALCIFAGTTAACGSDDPGQTGVSSTTQRQTTTTKRQSTTTAPARIGGPETAAVSGGGGVSIVDAATGDRLDDLVIDGAVGRAVGFGDVEVAPDGQTVYAVAVIGPHQQEIHAATLDGSSRMVAAGEDVAISHDGALLAYTEPVPVPEGVPVADRETLVVRDLATGEERRWENAALTDPGLSADISSLTWSSDSQNLAYQIRYEDGVEVRVLSPERGQSVLDGQQIEPPDGSAFAMPAYRRDVLAVVEQQGGVDPAIAPERFAVVEVGHEGQVAGRLAEVAGPVISIDFDSTGDHMVVVIGHADHDRSTDEPRPNELFRWSEEALQSVPLETEPTSVAW